MTINGVIDTFSSLSMVQPYCSPSGSEGAATEGFLFGAFGVAALAANITIDTVRDWDRSRYAMYTEPSKQRLMQHALDEMDPNKSGVWVSSGVRERLGLLLQDLISSAQPTPQLAVDEGGGVEALWLVNGTEVVLSLEPNGSGVLGAYSIEGDLFEYEFDERSDPLDRDQIARARRLLNQLGESVAHRVLL